MATDLGTLYGGGSVAKCINNTGVIVGRSEAPLSDDVFAYHAFVATVKHGTVKMTDLNDVSNSSFTLAVANAVSNTGQIAGRGGDANDINLADAFFATPTKNGHYNATPLHGLTNTYATDDAVPIGMNDVGQVVGSSYDGNDVSHAVMWRIGKHGSVSLLDLGMGTACEINNAGTIVGRSTMYNGEHHGFVWQPGTNGHYVATDLNTLISPSLGLTITNGLAINKNGQIAADAIDANGNRHALLLNPNRAQVARLYGNRMQPAMARVSRDLAPARAAVPASHLAQTFSVVHIELPNADHDDKPTQTTMLARLAILN